MTHEVDIETVRRGALRAANEDGVAELVVGLAMLALGGALVARWPFYAMPVVLLVVPVKRALRGRVSLPRVGYAEAAGSRLRAMAPWFVLGLVTLVISTWLVIASGAAHPRPWPAHFVPLAATIVVAAPFLGLARLTRLGRFTALAVLLPLCGLACSLAMPEAGIPAVGAALLASGVIAAVTGAVAMSRFIATHPRHGGEGNVA